jgi:hypothetical protein
MGGELPLDRAAALELITGCDDPETHGIWITACHPSMNNIVHVIERVLVLVIHLKMVQLVVCSCLSHASHLSQSLFVRPFNSVPYFFMPKNNSF